MMTSDSLNTEGMIVDGKVKVFGLSRMLETIMVNLHRIETFWDIVNAHYLCISHANLLSLRTQGVENLNIVIEKLIEYKEQHHEKDDSHEVDEKQRKLKEKWNSENWQKTLFQPWLEISKTKFIDVKENVCSSLLKLLQSHGHKINVNGWETIASILFEISLEGGRPTQLGSKILLS